MRRFLKRKLEDLVGKAEQLPTTIRINGGGALPTTTIVSFTLVNTEEPRVEIIDQMGGYHEITGVHAVEAVMAYRPALFEGRKMRWHRNAWVVHNLIGHPLMQILALLGKRELALKVHDATVPGRKKIRGYEIPNRKGVAPQGGRIQVAPEIGD